MTTRARADRSRRHRTEGTAGLIAVCALGLMMSCGGGGGGGGDDSTVPPTSSPSIAYTLGAPNAGLGQQPLAMTLAAPQGSARAVPLAARTLAALPTGTFVFPPGPDAAGDALPRIVGDYDRLTERYTDGIGAKLWIDLPASADAHPVALEVTRVLQPSDAAVGTPGSGEIVVTRRSASADFAGQLRLAFNTGATPICLAWDAARDGGYEVERCMTSDALVSLWPSPDSGLAIPATVQRAAGATYVAWTRFQGQFEFAVAALRIAGAQHDALATTPAGAVAATVTCSVYPPAGRAGAYTLRWLDRNGSGRFDAGDDVRFEATACWERLDEGDAGPGRTLDGVLELRGYERDVGAAPTYLALAVTDTEDVAGVVTPQATTTLAGGFTARLPGLLAASAMVESYLFDAGNMVAAGGVAARSMAYYPDIGELGFRGLEALMGGATGTRDLGLCSSGTGTVTLTEGAAPNVAGLSASDTVRVLLLNCDMGRAGNPRLHSGSLVLTVATVTRGAGTDWTVEADAQVDLNTVTVEGSTRRLGEFGFRTDYVLGHSYGTGFRPQGYVAGRSVSGVLTALKNGEPDYQLGCFDAGTYRGTWDWSDLQLKPNQVVKTAGRVFTLGTRQGESYIFKADALGRYAPDVGQSGMQPISAPECVALGVPASGVSGGDNAMIFDTWPAGDGGRVRLQLNDKAGTMIAERWVDWLTLVR